MAKKGKGKKKVAAANNGSEPVSVLQEIVASLGDHAPDPKKVAARDYPREVLFAVGDDACFSTPQYDALSPEAKRWLAKAEKLFKDDKDATIPPPSAMQEDGEEEAVAAEEEESTDEADAEQPEESESETTETEAEAEPAPAKAVKKAKKGKKGKKAATPKAKDEEAPVTPKKAKKTAAATTSDADITEPLAFARKLLKDQGPVTVVRAVTTKFKHLQRRDVLAIAAQLDINKSTAATQFQRARKEG